MTTTHRVALRCPSCDYLIGNFYPSEPIREVSGTSVQNWLRGDSWSGTVTPSSALYHRYQTWTEARGEGAVSHRIFSLDLQALGVVKRKAGRGVRVFEMVHR